MFEIRNLGLIDYHQAWEIQKQCLADRLEETIPDTLLICQHPPVYTVGRRARLMVETGQAVQWPETLLGVPVVEVERGGQMTFHGPGQLIAYPIFKIPGQDLRRFLRLLEEVVIITLNQFALRAFRNPPHTGVWVHHPGNESGKIASIGVASKKWVSYHGMALNVASEIQYFQAISPCGLTAEMITCLNDILQSVNYPTVQKNLIQAFEQVFQSPHDLYLEDEFR